MMVLSIKFLVPLWASSCLITFTTARPQHDDIDKPTKTVYKNNNNNNIQQAIQPTDPPSLPLGKLRKRVFYPGSVCGFTEGSILAFPAICSTDSTCAWDVSHGVVGCIPTLTGTTALYTACKDSLQAATTRPDQTGSDKWILTCSERNLCMQVNYPALFGQAFSQFQCTAISTGPVSIATSLDGVSGQSVFVFTTIVALTDAPFLFTFNTPLALDGTTVPTGDPVTITTSHTSSTKTRVTSANIITSSTQSRISKLSATQSIKSSNPSLSHSQTEESSLSLVAHTTSAFITSLQAMPTSSSSSIPNAVLGSNLVSNHAIAIIGSVVGAVVAMVIILAILGIFTFNKRERHGRFLSLYGQQMLSPSMSPEPVGVPTPHPVKRLSRSPTYEWTPSMRQIDDELGFASPHKSSMRKVSESSLDNFNFREPMEPKTPVLRH